MGLPGSRVLSETDLEGVGRRTRSEISRQKSVSPPRKKKRTKRSSAANTNAAQLCLSETTGIRPTAKSSPRSRESRGIMGLATETSERGRQRRKRSGGDDDENLKIAAEKDTKKKNETSPHNAADPAPEEAAEAKIHLSATAAAKSKAKRKPKTDRSFRAQEAAAAAGEEKEPEGASTRKPPADTITIAHLDDERKGAAGSTAAASSPAADPTSPAANPDDNVNVKNNDKEGNENSSTENNEPFIPSGILIGHRVLRSFGEETGGCFVLPTPTSPDRDEKHVPSALFVGTVVAYRPPKAYEDLKPQAEEEQETNEEEEDQKKKRGGRGKKKRRGGRPKKGTVRPLDFALYRVKFDDGDVMDMEPREVYECSRFYDAKREELLNPPKRNGRHKDPCIMGRDYNKPTQPANLESGLRELRRHSNPNVFDSSIDALQELDAEIQGYWVQYRVHHIQKGLPRPPSLLDQYRDAYSSADDQPAGGGGDHEEAPPHHNYDDGALLFPFANNFDHHEESQPTFDFNEIGASFPGGSLPFKKRLTSPLHQRHSAPRAVSCGDHSNANDGLAEHPAQAAPPPPPPLAAAPARQANEDISIVSDDDNGHCEEARPASPLPATAPPHVSPEHTSPESPPRVTATEAESSTSRRRKELHDTLTLAQAIGASAPLRKGALSPLHESLPEDEKALAQEHNNVEQKKSPANTSTEATMDEDVGETEHKTVGSEACASHESAEARESTVSQAFTGKLQGFEKRVSDQHRRKKKPRTRPKFPVLPLARHVTGSATDSGGRKRKGSCTPKSGPPLELLASLASEVNPVTPSPTGHGWVREKPNENIELPDLLPDAKKRKSSVDLPVEEVSKPSASSEGSQKMEGVEMSEHSEHSTMHAFAEIMSADTPERKSANADGDLKEPLAYEPKPGVTSEASPAALSWATGVVRAELERASSCKQSYSILSRHYDVGPGSGGVEPDIHVVLSAIVSTSSTEPKVSSRTSTPAPTQGEDVVSIPSPFMRQSQDSITRFMSPDYRYKPIIAKDDQFSSLPNIPHLADCLATRFELRGLWNARVDLVLSVEEGGHARWPGKPSVDKFSALSVMVGLPVAICPPVMDSEEVVAFQNGGVVEIVKGYLRGKRGVVTRVMNDRLMVTVLENGVETEKLLRSSDVRDVPQADVMKSLLQGSSAHGVSSYAPTRDDLFDLDLFMGANPNVSSTNRRAHAHNDEFLADMDHMLTDELHEIDAAQAAMHMFPGDATARDQSFVPPSEALEALKATPKARQYRGRATASTPRKPKGRKPTKKGRARKANAASIPDLPAETKNRGRKRKREVTREPKLTNRRGRKPISDDEDSVKGSGAVKKRGGRKPGPRTVSPKPVGSTITNRRSRSTKSESPAPADGPTTKKRGRKLKSEKELTKVEATGTKRRGRTPKNFDDSEINPGTTTRRGRKPFPGKVSDDDSDESERVNTRRGNRKPKEPVAPEIVLKRIEQELQDRSKAVAAGNSKPRRKGGRPPIGDISTETWGNLALMGCVELRACLRELGYKANGTKADLLKQLKAAYERLEKGLPVGDWRVAEYHKNRRSIEVP